MCDPVSIGLAVAGTIATVGGGIMSSNAQSSAAKAIADSNMQQFQAQNLAFNERNTAARAQTAAQLAASDQTLAERNQAATQMRQSQIAAQQRQQDILAAENKQQDALRGQGDQQAQLLLDQTNQQQLAAAQQQSKDQAALLLDQSAPAGPQPGDPVGTGDDQTKQAIATRMAQAASNVRTYGAKVAALTAAQQPVQNIGLAIAANKYGIMPAQQAETLLRSGSDTRLLPAQVAFRNAGDLGSAMDNLITSKGQNNLDAASLAYNNAVANANLQQGDTDTIAQNVSAQKQADAAFQQQVGGIISGIGQLGLYGAGRVSGATPFKSAV